MEAEAGVTVEPERPHAVTESVHRCGEATLSFSVVTFLARPVSTQLPPDEELGLAEESIETAGWFESFPEEMCGKNERPTY